MQHLPSFLFYGAVAIHSRSLHGYTWQQRTQLWQRYCAVDSIREIAADLAKMIGAVLGLIRLTGGMPSSHA